MLYRRHAVDEETPVQFVGVYVTHWQGRIWGEPEVMFSAIEGTEADVMNAAPEMLEVLKELVIECEDGDFASMVPSTILAIVDDTIKPLLFKIGAELTQPS